MVKAIALWSRPQDPGAFEKDYFGRHLPLARSAGVPGLRDLITSCAIDEDQPHYRAAELVFDDADSLKKAMASPELASVFADGQRLQDDHGVTVALLMVVQDNDA
jgi:uncharacterized protein (TIGR02118 family)